MTEKRSADYEHQVKIYDFADKALSDLAWVAPEDRDMRRTKIGDQMLLATEPLREIHRLLDGKEWSPDTLDEIARILTDAGFVIKEPE